MNLNERLVEASKIGDHECIRELLVLGASVDFLDSSEWTALHWASQEGHLPVVELLLKNGASPNAEDSLGLCPLEIAVGVGNTSIVSVLLMNGANVNRPIASFEGGTVLHLACSWGSLSMVKLLIEGGKGNSTLLDSERRTPLHFAEEGGFDCLVEYLKSIAAV